MAAPRYLQRLRPGRPALIKGAQALIVLACAWALISIVRTIFGAVTPDPPAPPPADIATQMSEAATFALRTQGVDGYVAREPRQESATRWQMSLIDTEGRCWKVAVDVDFGVARPDGQPIVIGCWPMPAVADGPVGNGDVDAPSSADVAAVRGFLDAYLTGGDLARWSVGSFNQPAPLHPSDYELSDFHDLGSGEVAVNGWVRVPTAEDSGARVAVTWRVTLGRDDRGSAVVSALNAGPQPPSDSAAPSTTVPPTTTSTTPSTTSTTTASSSTTSKER